MGAFFCFAQYARLVTVVPVPDRALICHPDKPARSVSAMIEMPEGATGGGIEKPPARALRPPGQLASAVFPVPLFAATGALPVAVEVRGAPLRQ